MFLFAYCPTNFYEWVFSHLDLIDVKKSMISIYRSAMVGAREKMKFYWINYIIKDMFNGTVISVRCSDSSNGEFPHYRSSVVSYSLFNH